MKKVLHALQRLEKWIIVIAFVIMVVAIFCQVVNRNIFKIPVSGFEEAVAFISAHGPGPSEASVTRDYNNSVPEGVVVSSSPREGSRVLSGKQVDLVVSLGKPKVPQIPVGTTLAEAENTVRNAKLQPKHDDSTDQYHTSVPEGRIIGVDMTDRKSVV